MEGSRKQSSGSLMSLGLIPSDQWTWRAWRSLKGRYINKHIISDRQVGRLE